MTSVQDMGSSEVSIPASQFQKSLDAWAAMVDLMRALRAQCRPSAFPRDLRAAWDACEKVIGEELSLDIELSAQQVRKAGEQLELVK